MATINGIVTIDDIWAVSLSGDPSISGGTVAPVGTIGGATDGTGVWAKTGALDTAWSNLASLTGGVILPANGGTGIVNNNASTITISGSFASTFVVTGAFSYTYPTASSTLLANNLGLSGGTTFVGGTGVTDSTIYKGTSGNGTSTLVAHSFVGGNNGATTIASLYNDGQFLVGTTTRIGGALGVARFAKGTATADIGQLSTGIGAIWLTTGATPLTTNYTLASNVSTTTINGVAINLASGGIVKWLMGSAGQLSTSFSSSSGVAFAIIAVTAQQNNTVPASTEMIDIRWNLSATKQWSTGALALQRDFVINARTYGAVGASVFTDVATFSVSSSPMAGANMTLTNSHGILIQSGAVAPLGVVTNSYGLTVNAQTGATNNFVAQFLGGGIVIGDVVNFILNATTGTKIGTATSQKLGFWNATPIIQPASVNQSALINSTGGTYNGTLVDVGVVYSQANINDNLTDVFTLLDAMRTAMVNAGLMKGAA